MPTQTHTSHFLTGPTRITFERGLTREGIPSKAHVYYIHRANQFIKSANDRDPAELSVKEIGDLLGDFGRNGNLADWQFGQLFVAVHILLTHCHASMAAAHVDWAYWKASARSLSAEHTTTAREHTPDELVYLKFSRGSGEYTDIRRQRLLALGYRHASYGRVDAKSQRVGCHTYCAQRQTEGLGFCPR